MKRYLSIFFTSVLALFAISLTTTTVLAQPRMVCEYTLAPGTLNDTNTGAVQCDSRGTLKTTLAGSTGGTFVAVGTAADAGSSTAVGLTTVSRGVVYNGATWDRAKGDTNATIVAPGLVTSWWRYAPPTGGYLNSTAGIAIKAAAGAGVSNYVWGITCNSETLATATEMELRDGAAGAVMWRTKIGTTGGTFDVDFYPPLRGTANTLVEFAGVTASATGAIYCNARGTTGP